MNLPEKPKGLSFDASREFLYALEKFGIKMDLDNISALMKFAGDPQQRLRVIHVAGTNGKGSTCAMIASVLKSAGYKVGLYTSPHIVNFTERFKIDGKEISEDEVAVLVQFFREEILRLRATFFEATTAIMFKYFADNRVDYAVVETGLGGRLDATNIVEPMISVITGIAMDHTEILGDTPEKIAYEKAGIIKQRRPAVVNTSLPSLKSVFNTVAEPKGAQLTFVDENTSVQNVRLGIDWSEFDASAFDTKFNSLRIDLGGRHQVANCLTALTALCLLENEGVALGELAIREGLSHIRVNTGHRGRLEVLSLDPLIILDVAHNPDGIRALVDGLEPLAGRKRPTLLFAAMRDKDAISMLGGLRERFSNVILTQLQTSRSLGVAELKKLSIGIKLDTQVFANSTEALRAAISQTDNDSYLLITGSHYLAGEVLPVLEKSSTGRESL